MISSFWLTDFLPVLFYFWCHFAMPPPAAVPKSFWGPPARDPLFRGWFLQVDVLHNMLVFTFVGSASSQVSQTQKLVLPDWALPGPRNRVGNHGRSRSRPPLFLEFGTLRIVVSLTSCCEIRNMPIMERIDLFVWSDWQLVRRMVVSIVGSEVGGPRLSTR